MIKITLQISALLIFFAAFMNAQSNVPDSTKHPDSLSYEAGEIVITGTRPFKKIIDIPYSVTRVSKTDFQYDSKISVDDVLGNIPGLFLQSRYGNHDVRISMRGFGSRSNSGIRGVRILMDGMPESEPDGQTRIEAIDFNSIGSIEIIKGNSSSLYTNAPGGIINFINDKNYPSTFFTQFNEFGSYGLRRNGFKTGIRTNNVGLLATYSYHNFKGFRPHSEDYWHIINSVMEVNITPLSNLFVLANFADGIIRLPGSLKKAEYEEDPYQAASREVDFDFKRISKKGRLGLEYNAFLDEQKLNKIELTGYGALKYFERAAANYRVINRYHIGTTARFVNKMDFGQFSNEVQFGLDLYTQAGPEDAYNNINGKKGDILEGIVEESISNTGFYIQNTTDLIKDKMMLLLTGRYDKVVYDSKNYILESQNAKRSFEAFTPKVGLNYKLTPDVAVYTSYGLSFDSPAFNEMDDYPTDTRPSLQINPDLQAQKSRNFEVGIKAILRNRGTDLFNNINFEITFFNSIIKDEIVPFEVGGDYFYRNSAETNRKGIEAGADIEIIERLRFNLAYTWSDFVYSQYSSLSITDTISTFTDFGNNIVPSVPEHNIVVSLSYEYPFTTALTGFIKGSYLHVSGMYVNDENVDKTKGYNLVNGVAGLNFQFNRFNVLLSGGLNNITDMRYVGFVNINSASQRFYEAGEPRNFYTSLNLGYTF